MALYETLLSLFLSVLLVVVAMRMTLSMWMGWSTMRRTLEAGAQWRLLNRSLATDIHAALSASVYANTLTLNLAGGVQYKYAENTAGQFVRVRTGGGTAVFATGLQSLDVSTDGMSVHLTASFPDIGTKIARYCTLKGALQ